MKKIKELKRIKQVLESDRLGISGNCKEVLKRDILDVFSNYFEMVGQMDIKIEGVQNGFNILISCHTQAFKGFKILTN